MAIDKAKTVKAAEKYLAAGKVAQAIDEYQKVLKENPKDWNLMIQMGDLYLKINKTTEAVQLFTKVADHYYVDGFFLKAIAIYKRVNKLDPTLIDICIKLSDLYLKQGLTMDAKSQLQVVAQHYLAKNQTKDAIQTYRKLIEIEPDNLKTRNELAKAYKNEGMIPEAIKEYLEISDELMRKNLLKESHAVLESASKLDPHNASILRKLIAVHNEQNESSKASNLVEEALRSDPSNPEILALLAESYASRRQYAKAYETIDRALRNTPNTEPLWNLKGELYLKEGDLDKAFAQFSLLAERYLARKDHDKVIAMMSKFQKVDPTYYPPLQKLVDVYSALHQENNMLVTYNLLVDSYISRAMYPEAAKCLERLIAVEPDNAQHQEKLGFVQSFLGKSKPAAAPKAPAKEESIAYVEQPVMASKEEAILYKDPSEEVSPKDFDIALNLETAPGVPNFEQTPVHPPVTARAVTPAPVAQPPAPVVVTPRPQTPPAPRVATPPPRPAAPPVRAKVTPIVPSEEEKDYVSEHMIEAEVFTKYGLIDKAIEQLQFIVSKYPTSVVALQKLKEIYVEKGERDRAVEECVAMSRIFRQLGDLDQAEDLLSEARQINPNHPSLDQAFKELPAGSSVPSDALSEIEKLAQSVKGRPSAAKAQPAPAKVEPPKPPVAAAPPEEEEIEIEIEEAEPAPEPPPLTPIPPIPQAQKDEQAKEEVLEEIDFYINQGLISEAGRLLSSMQEKWPGDPHVLERMAALEKRTAPEVSEPMPEPVSEAQESEQVAEDSMVSLDEDLTAVSPTSPVEILPEVEEEEAPISIDLDSEEPVRAEVAESTPEEQSWDMALSSPAESESEIPEEPEVVSEPAPEAVEEEEISVLDDSQEMEAVSELPDDSLSLTPLAEEAPEPSEPEHNIHDMGLEPAEFGELESAEDMESEEESHSGAHGSAASILLDDRDGIGEVLDAAFDNSPERSEQSAGAKPVETARVKASEELFEEEDDFFDLAAELEEGFLNVQSAVDEERPPDGQAYSLEEILTDFKKGVEKQLGAEDYDTRYNLGIAYKEMGLIDEAIAEFQIASKDSNRLLECCSMLGLCFLEKGMPKLAIKWYERGLDTPNHSDEEYQGLRFDLAQTYEATGEFDKALEVYQEVYGMNANYRNVAKKIKEILDQVKKR